MRGLLVTGTDTGAGKTVVAAAACTALRGRGEIVAAFKPVVTGLDAPDPVWPPDHLLLGACARVDPNAVAPYTYGPPLSPHRAAKLAGEVVDPDVLVNYARALARGSDVLIAEGVGGLLVPLAMSYLVRDLAVDLDLPVVVAARAGLGTISHTLLTVESARAAGLRVAGVAMGPWPDDRYGAEAEAAEANADTVRWIADVDVVPVPRATAPTVAALTVVGHALPVDEWLAA